MSLITNITPDAQGGSFDLISNNPLHPLAIFQSNLASVRTTAVDKVLFLRNTKLKSNNSENNIAQRLGLLGFVNSKEVPYTLQLYMEGPVLVTSDQILPLDVINPGTFITHLTEGEVLNCVLFTAVGTGRQHAKWVSGVVKYNRHPGYFHFQYVASRLTLLEFLSELERLKLVRLS